MLKKLFKKNKELVYLVPILSLSLSLSNPVHCLQIIKGSHKVNRESRELTTFSKVKMNINGNLIIKPSENTQPILTIIAEDNLISYIQTDITDDTLEIEFKNKAVPLEEIVIKNCQPIELHLQVANLNEIQTLGNNNITIDSPLQTQKLTLHLNGNGKVNANVDSVKLLLKLAGNKELNLKGRVHDQDIEMSGNCKLLGQELHSKNTTIKLIGDGKAEVFASTYLNADIWGNGEINYSGNPKVFEKILGGGRIFSN